MRARVRSDFVAVRSHNLNFRPGHVFPVAGDVRDSDRARIRIYDSWIRAARDDVLRRANSGRIENRQAVVIHRLIRIVEIDRNETKIAHDEVQRIRFRRNCARIGDRNGMRRRCF